MAMKRLIQHTRLCDTNCSNKQGMSCLHLAAKYGHFEIVQYLIQNTTANLAQEDIYGKSPSYIAAEAGHFRILKCMVDRDKSCAFYKTSKKILLQNKKYARGSTLLHATSHGGHLEILEYLIQSCGCDYCCIDDDGIYPLYIACEMEQYKIAVFLMDKFRCDPNKRIINGRTCLHAACTSGSSSFFENLFGRFGCSYDCVDNEGITPLYIACEIGNITVVKLLINKNCDVTHKRYDGRSYLHAASSSGNLHIIQLLVNKFNQELNCKDNAGITPLNIACEKGYLELTKYFVAGNGCKPSKECFLAAETNNNIEVVDFLNDQCSIFQSSSDLNHEQKLQGNSDINHGKNSQSCTYIHKVSCQRERLDIIKYHINHHRCIVNRKDDDGNTPLFYACQSGDLDVVKYFISEHNFDPNQDTRCLEAACRSGKLDIVRFLIDDYKLKVCSVEKNDWSKYLHLATCSGNMATIKYFIHVKNANPNSKGVSQWYKSMVPNLFNLPTIADIPLICACEKGHLEAVKLFTEKHNSLNHIYVSNDVKVSPTHVASFCGRLDIVQYYIDNHYYDQDYLTMANKTPLFAACSGGQLNIVKYLILEKHCNIKIISCEGQNVVHAASESGTLEIVKFLKDNNCESNNRDLRGRTPLYLACLGGHTDIVKYLAAYHWDSDYVSNDGLSYLHKATIAGKLDVVKYLINDLKSNLDIESPSGSTAVHLACEHGHIEILQYLSKLEECNIDQARDDGMTCLHVAANYRKVDIVDYLINNTGCDINKKDKCLRSPLYLACELGYEEIAKKLLANKLCDVNVKSNSGQTCLHVAVIKKHLSVMTCLLQSPTIMTNITNKEGFTPLFKACYLGYLPIVCELLQCNRCDPQVKCINRTCFHAACASGKVAVVKYLVENWSHVYDINNQDNEGVTPLFLACRQGHIKIVKYLLEKTFSDPNIKTYITQKTCFHAASESGNKKVVAYLTRMFSVNIRDAKGVTSLHIACKAGHLEVVEFLTDKLQCDCNIITNNRSSYLHEASASGKVEVIKYIIDNCNCNLNGKDCNGFTPLLVACQGSDLTSVQYLINLKDCEKTCKTNVGWSCLHVASYHGNTKLVKYLASKFQKDDIENRDNFGTTPLYLACQEGHIDIIKFLVQNKHCDLKSQAHNGWTCLHAAISTGKLEVIKCINSMTMSFFYRLLHTLHSSAIIELGCNNLLHIAAEFGQLRIVQYLIEELKFDPNSRRPDQVLPIHLASFGGHYYVVDYLANKCMCNIQSIDVHGNTPLHFAAAGGHPHMIEYFVEKYNTEISTTLNISKDSLSYHQDFPLYYLEKMHFSDIFQDGLNKFSTTPLHCASAYGHINALKYLFDITKCDPLVKDSNGDTLLHIASRSGQLKVVKYLIENQLIKYDVEGHCKVTAVHCACAYGHLDVLKYIIENKSNDGSILIQCDEHKRTPLHYACAGGCLEVVKYIRLRVICDTNSMLDRDGNSPLHLAAMYGKLEVFELLIGSSITDRKYTPRMFDPSTKNLRKESAIDLAHSRVKCDIYGYFINEKTKDAAFQTPNSLSLASSLNIVVFGSRKVGKSSLIKALSTNRKFDWLFSFPITVNSSVSHTTTYKEYGCVTFYDTLSDERYHDGHSVILQQIHHPLVIVVISLSQSIEDIVTQLAYWFKLITDAGTCSHEVSDVIIVGSHSDKHATGYKESNINSMVKDYINSNAYCYKGSVFCDRRYSPVDMTLLHNLIASVRNERISAHDINETASTQKLSPTLFRYLQHLSTFLVSITLKELIKKAKNIECPDTNMIKLFDVNELNKTCQYLHSHGRISYFQHDENIENNVIILHEELLLMLLNFYLMTNIDKFKDGVMEVSHLKATICESFSPNMFDTDLAIKYLQSHHFCSEISYDVLNAIKHVKTKSRYFFFHKMIFTDRPRPDNSKLWYSDASGKENIWSVLCLKCKNDHFFNSQYLHALYIKIINREKHSDNTTLWNTGILLVYNGTRSIIEVTDLTSKIYLVIQCKENQKLELVQQRSYLFSMIKSLIKIVCFNVKYSEYILYMDKNVYPPKNYKEISISKVADALVEDVDNIVLDDCSEIELSKFLHKDFFKEAKRQDSFQLVQNRNLDKIVPTDLQSRLCNLFKEQFQKDYVDRPLSYEDLYNRAIKFSIFTDRPVYVSYLLIYSEYFYYTFWFCRKYVRYPSTVTSMRVSIFLNEYS